jgi:rhodanese-related sulfurtransferase
VRPASRADKIAYRKYSTFPLILLGVVAYCRAMSTLTTTATQLVAAAKQHIENLTPDQLSAELAKGEALLVDLREPEERTQNGYIEGAVHAPRGMLEFYADPTSAYHRPEFDPQRRTVVYCASGGRSALAARTLGELGYTNVAHLDGGLKAWAGSGRAVARP